MKTLDKLISNLEQTENKLRKLENRKRDYIVTLNNLFLEKLKLYLKLHPRAFLGKSYGFEIYKVEKNPITYTFYIRDVLERRYLFNVKIDEADLRVSLEEYQRVLLDKEREERYNKYIELKKEFGNE